VVGADGNSAVGELSLIESVRRWLGGYFSWGLYPIIEAALSLNIRAAPCDIMCVAMAAFFNVFPQDRDRQIRLAILCFQTPE
jgi:hypothetical protein